MGTRVVCIGQAPARPGAKHAVAGTYLRPWLYRLGLDEATILRDFRFYALVDSFPGSGKQGHLPPTREQVTEHQPLLISLIKAFRPDILVPVGAMAIKEILPAVTGSLEDIIGVAFEINPYNSLEQEIPVIPLPHPSGRSTWPGAHPDRVAAALALLRTYLARGSS